MCNLIGDVPNQQVLHTGEGCESLTWIFSFPNSLAKLWDSALRPNLPAANALVVMFPLKLAVAPVKINVPLFPSGSSILFCLNVRIASRENANAASTLVASESRISEGVISRNGFHTPYPTLKTTAWILNFGATYVFRMLCQTADISRGAYDSTGKPEALTSIDDQLRL